MRAADPGIRRSHVCPWARRRTGVPYQLLFTQPPGSPWPVPTVHERTVVPFALRVIENESPVVFAFDVTVYDEQLDQGEAVVAPITRLTVRFMRASDSLPGF